MYSIYYGLNPFENSDLILSLNIDDNIYEEIFIDSTVLIKYPYIKNEFFIDKEDESNSITFFNSELDVILNNLKIYLLDLKEKNKLNEVWVISEIIKIIKEAQQNNKNIYIIH